MMFADALLHYHIGVFRQRKNCSPVLSLGASACCRYLLGPLSLGVCVPGSARQKSRTVQSSHSNSGVCLPGVPSAYSVSFQHQQMAFLTPKYSGKEHSTVISKAFCIWRSLWEFVPKRWWGSSCFWEVTTRRGHGCWWLEADLQEQTALLYPPCKTVFTAVLQ